MKFSSVYAVFHNNPLWSGHVSVPTEVVEYFKTRNIKRLICTYNRQEKSHSIILSDGNGGYFIHLNKEIRKRLGLNVGSPVEVEMKEDNSKYGMPIPEEMRELLAQDSEGDHYFHSLTPGKQRSLLYIVGKPKGSETRLRKALVVVNYLKETKGKLDFKALNQAFKASSF